MEFSTRYSPSILYYSSFEYITSIREGIIASLSPYSLYRNCNGGKIFFYIAARVCFPQSTNLWIFMVYHKNGFRFFGFSSNFYKSSIQLSDQKRSPSHVGFTKFSFLFCNWGDGSDTV